MTLATTVALVVIRGPVGLAKTLGAIDRLSGGRVVAAVGPGSSAHDYALVGLNFEDRWRRFDEAVATLRALWQPEDPPFVGTVLLDRRNHVGSGAAAAGRAADLDRELGVRRRASSRGAVG